MTDLIPYLLGAFTVPYEAALLRFRGQSNHRWDVLTIPGAVQSNPIPRLNVEKGGQKERGCGAFRPRSFFVASKQLEATVSPVAEFIMPSLWSQPPG
jgi:hypothetical protein